MKNGFISTAAAILMVGVLAACGDNEKATETAGDTIATDTAATMATETAMTATAAGQLDAASQEFATKAGQAGLAEVAMGELGQQKAQHADVKAFAARMVTDHTANNQELQQIVTAKGLTPPAEMAPEQKGGLDHLQGMSGAEFDKTFMAHMVDDHQKAVDLFTNAQNVGDPELKAFAAKTLPVLQEHLQAAKDTQAKLQ